MALDLSAAALIRAGSGVLYAFAGILILLVGRHAAGDRKAARGAAIAAIGLGVYLVPRNIIAGDPALATLGTLLLISGYATVSFGLATYLRARAHATSRRALALTVAGSILSWMPTFVLGQMQLDGLIEASGLDSGSAPFLRIFLVFGVLANGLLAAAMLVTALDTSIPPMRRWPLAIAFLGLGGYSLLANGSVTSDPNYPTAYAWSSLLALVPFLVAGLIATRRLGRAVGWTWLWGTPLLVLLGGVLRAVDPAVGVGLARSLAAAALAYVALRHDAFGLHATSRPVSRGTLAAGALASLFIVAQIAQNFLSAEYGLLMGGVVAGAFLFAAQPLQRAMERLADKRPTLAAASPHPSENEDAYRRALRIALKDRVVSSEEEIHLADLGERLGIRAGRARELRHEIEGELRREAP